MNGRSIVLLKAVFRNLSGQDKHHRIRQCGWYPNQNLNSRSPEQCDDVLHIFLISKTLFITSQIFAYYLNHTLYDTRNKIPVINVLSSLCCVCTPTRHPAITVEKRGKRISQSCGWDSTCIVDSYRTVMWALHTVVHRVCNEGMTKQEAHGLWKGGWLTLFRWPCVTVYQHNETNVMHFSFSLLRINQTPLHVSSITWSSSGGASNTAFGILRAYVSWLWHVVVSLEKVALGQSFLRVLGFFLCHYHCINALYFPTFIYMFLLPEGQTRDTWECSL
jgi:hypothetical protein